jgi:DNA-binding transcriptional ArsR family regulator
LLSASFGVLAVNFLLVNNKDIPKSTLSLHFKILREAGLIQGERQGVEMLNTSRCNEIEKRFPGLIRTIVSAYQLQTAGERRLRKGGNSGRLNELRERGSDLLAAASTHLAQEAGIPNILVLGTSCELLAPRYMRFSSPFAISSTY